MKDHLGRTPVILSESASVGELLSKLGEVGGDSALIVGARDDGENGVALHFDWVEPKSEASLRTLIERLPAIEAPTASPNQRSGIVLTSVIPKLLRRRGR